MDRPTVGVIGCGYWGIRLVRNFNASDRWHLKTACDSDEVQLEKVRADYPAVETTREAADLFADEELDAIAIATPVATHFALAEQSLKAGKHTWVEKPMTASTQEADTLIEAASNVDRLLHVDHTYVYTPAVSKIRALIAAGELGDIRYFDSMRVNLGLFQHDVNVVWDLAPHDISILEHCVGSAPEQVSAHGKAHFEYEGKSLENVAYLTVDLAGGAIAHFNVNWLSPVKVRQILIGGSEKMLVFNDLEPIEKIKVYDYGVEITSREEIYRTLIQYRTGDMYSPNLPTKEALRLEVDHFAECVAGGRPTDTPGEAGRYVVQVLEAASASIAASGAPVSIPARSSA
jgi:predicted dehydrogenase